MELSRFASVRFSTLNGTRIWLLTGSSLDFWKSKRLTLPTLETFPFEVIVLICPHQWSYPGLCIPSKIQLCTLDVGNHTCWISNLIFRSLIAQLDNAWLLGAFVEWSIILWRLLDFAVLSFLFRFRTWVYPLVLMPWCFFGWQNSIPNDCFCWRRGRVLLVGPGCDEIEENLFCVPPK